MKGRRLPIEDKVALEDLVVRHADLLGEGMRIVALHLGTRHHGFLDLLGVDGEQRLVIIDLAVIEDDRLWVQSLGHFQWTDVNRDNISKMLRSHAIDPVLRPRIVLIAPGFSRELKGAASYFTFTQVDLFAYHYVEVQGERAFLLDPVDLPMEEERPQERSSILPREMVLSEEELAELLRFAETLRPSTSSEDG